MLRTYGDDASASEGDNHSNHIDSELKLQELCNRIVDVAAPHDSLDNAAEVVIGEDDVRGLLGNVSTRQTHGKADVGSFQCWSIISAITGDCHHFPIGSKVAANDTVHKNVFVLWC